MIGKFCHDIGGYCGGCDSCDGGGEERKGGCEKVGIFLVVFWVFLGEKKKKMTSIPYLPTTPLG